MPVRSRAKGKRSDPKPSTNAVNSGTTSTTTAKQQPQQTPGHPVDDNGPAPPATNATLLGRVLQPGTVLAPKDVLAATHWLRQLLAICLGGVFGGMRHTGLSAVATFVFIAFTAPFSFLKSLHPLDLDEIQGEGHIQTEGFFPALALFFLSWIIAYTIALPASA